MNPKSIQRTLGSDIREEDLLEARLGDYVRKWHLADWVIIQDMNKERIVPAIFLDIVREQGKEINGILFQLSKEELDKMDHRERNYDRIHVSNLVEPKVSEPVYTYVEKEQYTVSP